MKFFIVGFGLLAVAACVVAQYPSQEYLPPVQEIGIPSNEYLAPIAPAAPVAEYSSGVLADDGYRYKTVKRYRTAKRFRSRHRRDVSELSNEYLPPFQQQVSIPQESYAPIQSYAAPSIQSYAAPSNEYLAPIAPAAPVAQYSSGVLADDGYRYKTVKRYRTAKRFRSRHRRDVSELSNEYLPPFQQQVSIPQESYAPIQSYAAPSIQSYAAPSNEYLAPIAPAAPVAQYSSGVLADDGYRYKTVKRYRTAKRFRSRHRRDVSELSNEYLPPFQQQVSISQESYAPIQSYATPSNEYLAPIAPAAPIAQYSSGVLADDGYRYKTVKRYRTARRYRSRH